MITFLTGDIVEVKENAVSIDVAGVGYRVNAPTSVTGSLKACGVWSSPREMSRDRLRAVFGGGFPPPGAAHGAHAFRVIASRHSNATLSS